MVIVDEATVMTEAELLMVWAKNEILILIGDLNQLGPTVLSTKSENPFRDQLGFAPFVRFAEMGFPFHVLTESMRMTAGLLDLANMLFYGGKLLNGPGTELLNRPRTIKWQEFLKTTIPGLKAEPAGLCWPLLYDCQGKSTEEPGFGTSRINRYNKATVIKFIELVLYHDVFQPEDIGIVTPYAGQVKEYNQTIRQMPAAWRSIKVIYIHMDQWNSGKGGKAPYQLSTSSVRRMMEASMASWGMRDAWR